MSLSIIVLIIFILGFIFSGIILLKQSAKKFNLTEEQLTKIKKREKEQQIKEQNEK